ncbi:hypothetical protein [Burkholderia sp. 3C]
MIGDRVGGTALRARCAGGYYTTGSLKHRLNTVFGVGGGMLIRQRKMRANRVDFQ